ncbi:MAG: hypothetical protein ACRDI2_20165 [Chloroflexota bacterium]
MAKQRKGRRANRNRPTRATTGRKRHRLTFYLFLGLSVLMAISLAIPFCAAPVQAPVQ